MWLHVPKTFCHCVPESADWNLDWQLPQTEEFARCVTLNGKHMRRQYWQREWNKGNWITRLFGPMLPHSMANRGVELFMESLRDTHANHSARPDCDVVNMTRGIYGRELWESLKTSNRNSCFSKMSPGISLWDSIPSQTICKKWVSTLRRDCSLRRKSARHIDGKDSSYLGWPTTRVSMANGPWHAKSGKDHRHLETIVADWPTPRAQEANRTTEGYGRGLKELVEGHTQTPKKKIVSVEEQKWESSHPDPKISHDGKQSFPNGPTLRRRLNPKFAEWLMGWPIGHTAFGQLETALCHYVPQMHSYLCARLWTQHELTNATKGNDHGG